MKRNFFYKTAELKGKILERIVKDFSTIKDKRIRQILLQRQKSTNLIKGISSYYIHKGLNGKLNEDENIKLSSAIEIYSTGLVILDNIIDSHEIRDGKTTYLKEYGVKLNTLASHYSTHLGIVRLIPHINKFLEITGELGGNSIEDAIEGMISMDLNKPIDSPSILEAITRVNGITLGVPLGISATTATNNRAVIYDIIKYGVDTGIAFGLYEELRDFRGKHGRKRALEIENGRTPYFFVACKERDSNFIPNKYVGKKIGDYEYFLLLDELRESGALKHTSNLIKNHLGYGEESLKKNLNKRYFDKLNLLKHTIEDSLPELIS